MRIPKVLHVGKTERYEVGITSWLAGEPLLSATVVSDGTATIGAVDVTGDVVGFFATGVTEGRCAIHLNYSTATRSECSTVTIIVDNC